MTTIEDQARSIFLAALECEPEQWPAWLDEACGDRADLRARVEQLLHAHQAMGSIHGGGAEPPVATVEEQRVSERPGTLIGPYKLLEQIGEGGMGTVWMAQQTEPVKRLVAVKLIKAGMDSKQVLARFDAERQALALMDHPNIAKVLDGGTTSAGRPYFVMDLVKGVPITKYCDDHKLTTRQRLELFIPVCQAVQHAHQKSIIHRDLKPSNVLVALYDGKPVPKVIDFGVAKATGPSLTEKTLVTGFGAIVGTPEYMSPEQAELNNHDIDTRSDIYSLGVLLYELLTGSPPFRRKDLEKAGMLEMLRVIREQEPPKPSTKLSTAEGLPTLAANRGTEPAKLTRLVRGELDWIVMKALEKDRGRRYETANAFAQDVQRYLNDEPVLACPPSVGYRLRKFVRRNRGLVLATSVIFVLLVGGVVGTTLGLFQALSAEQKAVTAQNLANTNEVKARGVVNRYFTLVSEEALLDMPGFQPLREKLLQEACWYFEELLQQRSDDPAIQAELAVAYLRLGEIYQATGKGNEFISAFRTGVELAARLIRENPDERDIHRRLAGFWKGHRRLHLFTAVSSAEAQAEPTLQQASLLWQRLVRENPSVPEFQSDLAAIYSHISELYYRQPQQLVSWQTKALDIRTSLVHAHPLKPAYQADLATSHTLLGTFYGRVGQHAEAVEHLRAAAKVFDELRAESPKVPFYREGLALAKQTLVLNLDGGPFRSNQSEQLLRECSKLFEDLAAEFPRVPSFLHSCAYSSFKLGDVLANSRQPQEAEKAYRRALQIYCELLEEFPRNGDYVWGVRWASVNLVNLLKSAGRPQEAPEVSRRPVEIYKKHLPQYRDDAEFRRELARAYALDGLPAKAIDEYAIVIKLKPKIVQTYLEYAAVLQQVNRTAEAIKAYGEALELDQKNAETLNTLARLLVTCSDLQCRDTPRAIQLAEEAVQRAPKAWAYWDTLGVAHDRAGNWEQSADAFSRAIDVNPNVASPWTGRGLAYLSLGRWEKGGADLAKAVELVPRQPLPHYYHAFARLALADARHYRASCAHMVTRFATTSDPNAAFWTVWTCVLAPDAVADWGPVVRLAEKAVADDPKNSDKLQGLGAVLYRAGRYEDAARRLEEAEEAVPENQNSRASPVYTWLFQAMTLYRLGRADEAQRQLRRAVSDIDQPSEKTKEANATWNRRLTLRLLRQEAEDLLKQASGANGQPARKPD